MNALSKKQLSLRLIVILLLVMGVLSVIPLDAQTQSLETCLTGGVGYYWPTGHPPQYTLHMNDGTMYELVFSFPGGWSEQSAVNQLADEGRSISVCGYFDPQGRLIVTSWTPALTTIQGTLSIYYAAAPGGASYYLAVPSAGNVVVYELIVPENSGNLYAYNGQMIEVTGTIGAQNGNQVLYMTSWRALTTVSLCQPNCVYPSVPDYEHCTCVYPTTVSLCQPNCVYPSVPDYEHCTCVSQTMTPSCPPYQCPIGQVYDASCHCVSATTTTQTMTGCCPPCPADAACAPCPPNWPPCYESCALLLARGGCGTCDDGQGHLVSYECPLPNPIVKAWSDFWNWLRCLFPGLGPCLPQS